jgi:Uma2 family endonuclease
MVQTPSEMETLSLELPRAIALHVTPEQFEAITVANQDLRLERTAAGELIVNPPTGGESGARNRSITGQLDRWYEEHEDLGEAFDSSTGFKLLCPDFVVELRSESDSLTTLQAKMREYRENGARLGWLIDPQNRRVEIYRPGVDVEVLENLTELSGEDVLPGFVLNLRRLWR